MGIFENSKQTYGSPRITQELRAQGRRVSKNRIAEMMRAAEIRAIKPGRYIVTTDSKHNYPIVPNVLERRFLATRESEIIVAKGGSLRWDIKQLKSLQELLVIIKNAA